GDAFEEYMETLISSHTIESIREVWWDIRPHPNFGTVELRICDGIPTLDEISAVAAMSQSLLEPPDRQRDKEYTLPQQRMWRLLGPAFREPLTLRVLVQVRRNSSDHDVIDTGSGALGLCADCPAQFLGNFNLKLDWFTGVALRTGCRGRSFVPLRV